MLLHILKYLFAREFHKINSLHLSLKYFLLKYALATNSIHTLEKMILDTIPWCIESKIKTYSPTNKNSPENYNLSCIHTKAVYCVFLKAALICNDCQVAEFVNDDFLHRFPTITHCKTAVLWIWWSKYNIPIFLIALRKLGMLWLEPHLLITPTAGKSWCTYHTALSSQPAWVWPLLRPSLTWLPPRHGIGCWDRGSPGCIQLFLDLLLFCGWQTSKIWELFKSWILTQETRIIMILSNYPGIHKFHFTQQI